MNWKQIMSRSPSCIILFSDDQMLVVKDRGLDTQLTITNGAEEFIRDIAPTLESRRLFYYDTNGVLDELIVKDGSFYDFR